MKVAIIREGKYEYPKLYLRNLMILSGAQNIEMFLCHFNDFNFDEGLVNGLFFDNGNWIWKKTNFPDVVDNPLVTKENAPVLARLSHECIVMNHRIGAKKFIYPILKKDPIFEPYFIPTENLLNSEQVFTFLEKYSGVIVKPGNGRKARGIIKIVELNDKKYEVTTNESKSKLDVDGLNNFLKEQIKDDVLVLQPFINTTTVDGHPFHVRMLVRKNEINEFEVVKNYAEIGIGSKLVSNMHVGGGLVWLDTMLKIQFGDNFKSVLDEINKMAKILPPAFQSHFDYHLSALGIDIAIDQKGHPWILEVNAGPGHEYVKLEDIEGRIKDYVNLCNQVLAAKKFNNKSLFRVAEDIKKRL